VWLVIRAPFVALKDKAAGVEVYRKYNTQDWAQRHPKTQHDLDAPKVNANVYIATRAISDAIKGLPVFITQKEMVRGAEREIEDADHPANELLKNPNPEHSWSDIVDHIVKSYLNDGNAIMTIERMTGPNPYVEIWPRDPRTADIATKSRHYRFGKYTPTQKTYPRDRVIHIRDMDVDDPFWGIGRVNTVREEIMMDYFVNRFNSNFFRYGATLNLMFTPNHDLTEDQHLQILDAMSADMGGAERAFKIFINRYGGKFEYPDQKHKEIAFLDLLKHNREKIFGVFGLPPFRGGVMEYANYANALAQDKDFWNNTVAPILKVIEDAMNKQLLWPIFGQDVGIKFDLDSVPAIKGDQTEIEDRLLKLKEKGVVSAEYVREQLGIDESAAPVVPDALKPTAGPQGEDEEDDGEEEQPTQDEEQEAENALFKLFKLQRERVLQKLLKLTCGGSMMSVLCDPDTQAPKVYDTIFANKSMRNTILPITRKVVMERGTRAFTDEGIFSMEHELIDGLMRRIVFKIEDIADQNGVLLAALLDDADRYGWTYRQLEKRVKGVFSYERAHNLARLIVLDTVNSSRLIFEEMKHQRNDRITVATLTDTKPTKPA
jgi:HK97 family phage portal protein